MARRRLRTPRVCAWLLGGCLLVVTLAGGCGRVQPSPEEAAAVAVVEKLGGTVVLRETDSTVTVIQVDLRKTATQDADLEPLAKLPNVEMLHLGGTQIGDAGLAHVAGMTKLQELYLGRTQVTDAGLKHLHGMKDLKWLAIKRTKVTEAGVKELQKAVPGVRLEH